MDVSFLSLQQAALAPVVVGLVSALRTAFSVSDRYVPLVSILVGIGGAFIFPAVSVGLTILAGAVIGLTASGLYSGGKSLIQG